MFKDKVKEIFILADDYYSAFAECISQFCLAASMVNT